MVSAILHVLRDGPVRSASLHDVELSDAVLVLGEDVTNTAPMLALALRQSVRRQPMEVAAKLHIPRWDDAAVRRRCRERRGRSSSRRSRDAAGRHRDGHVSRAPPTISRGLASHVAHALDASAPGDRATHAG